jgi:hypothetical protein
MDTTSAGTSSTHRPADDASEPRRRRLLRTLLTAALACFALPFLTVTCYGDDTVSGVQAATEIDIYPSHGERELAREEPPNVFAFAALVAAAGALALAFGSKTTRRTLVGFAAAGVLALDGFYLYAFNRTFGEALPRVGLTSAIALLVASAWLGAGTVPRWIAWALGILALGTIPITFLHAATVDFGPWLFLLFYAGLIVSVALAVGAIQASRRPPSGGADPSTRPSILRIVIAGTAGLACLAVAGVAAPLLMGSMLSDSSGPERSTALAFACIVLASYAVASIAAWGVGRAIVRGGRRRGSLEGPGVHSARDRRRSQVWSVIPSPRPSPGGDGSGSGSSSIDGRRSS